MKRLSLHQFLNHPFILRITEENGIPHLLRKNTSCNGNGNGNDNSSKEINIPENGSHEPVSLHHRKNPYSKSKTEKQFTSQINYMRYIYRLLELFPRPEDSGMYTLGLRFIATKQMLSLLEALQDAMGKGNLFNFDGWDEFIAYQDKYTYYKQILDEYGQRYEKNKREFEDLVELVKKDKKLTSIADMNFTRC